MESTNHKRRKHRRSRKSNKIGIGPKLEMKMCKEGQGLGSSNPLSTAAGASCPSSSAAGASCPSSSAAGASCPSSSAAGASCPSSSAAGASCPSSSAAGASCPSSSAGGNHCKASQVLHSKSFPLQESCGKSTKVTQSALEGKCWVLGHNVSDSVCVVDGAEVKDCSKAQKSKVTKHSGSGILPQNGDKCIRNRPESSRAGKRRKSLRQIKLSPGKLVAVEHTSASDRTHKSHNAKSVKLSENQIHSNSIKVHSGIERNISRLSSVSCKPNSGTSKCLSLSSKWKCSSSQEFHEFESSRISFGDSEVDGASSTGARRSFDAGASADPGVPCSSASADPSVDCTSAGAQGSRQLHLCPEPWRFGLENAPVQLCTGDSRGQPHHRQILALLNRITNTRLEMLVQRTAALLLQPRPCGAPSAVCSGGLAGAAETFLSCSSCRAAALCSSQLLTRRRDLISMLLHKAQDEDLYTEHYCRFLQGVSLALELHDEAVMEDLAPVRAEAALLQEICAPPARGGEENEASAGRTTRLRLPAGDVAVSTSPKGARGHSECPSTSSEASASRLSRPSGSTVTSPREPWSPSEPRLALLQDALSAEKARHLLLRAPSFRELLQEACVRRFHALLGTLTAMYAEGGAWCPRTDVTTRQHIKCHMRLLVQLQYRRLLPLRSLQEARDVIAAPLQAAFSSAVQHDLPPHAAQHDLPPHAAQHDLPPRAVQLSAELLCSYLQAAGPCNLYTPARTDSLCHLLQLVLPQLPPRLGFLVRDVLESWALRWTPLTPPPLRAG